MADSEPQREDRPVLFLDSGVGGLPYLSAAAAEFPNERFIYLADRRNFPYGERAPEEVQRAILAAAGAAVAAFRPKVSVVACNTASVVALDALRAEYAIPFVGVVPAVKPAAEQSRSGRIGVLATARTVEDRYLLGLIERFAADCYVLSVAGGDIVTFVERRYFVSQAVERRTVVQEAARRLREARIDTVVLGCTHFLHVERELAEALGPDIRVIDSRAGVTRRLGTVLREHGLARSAERTGERTGDRTADARARMYVTCGPGDSLDADSLEAESEDYQRFAEQFGLTYNGVLPVEAV